MAIDKNAVIKEAQKFAAKGQYDKAIAEWKKLAKESPNDSNICNTIGDLCLKKNAKPEAVEAYKKAADILASDGFTSKAIALYKKVLNIDPKKIEVHLALGDMNAEKGLTSNALESYKIVADFFSHNKETAKALTIYQKMADLNASNAAFRIKLADMYAKEGMKKEAIKAYLQAADVHVSKEAYNDARQIFEKALALDSNNADIYHKAGLVYFKEGKFAEACKALKPAFEHDQSNLELSSLYVDALTKAGRPADAEDVYKKLVSQYPDRADIREKLYRFYVYQKEYDKAFSEVSSLANIKIEAKDFDAAEELFKGFIAGAPRHIDGKRALSALYKTVGKTTEAANVLVQAAETLIEDGDKGGAHEILQKVMELTPDHARARVLLDQVGPAPEPAQPAAAAAPEAPVAEAAQPATLAAEDPAVAEALTEVDVLVKYGLATKAIEQLEALAKKFPSSVQTRIKLRDLYGDQGNMARAAVHMLVMADLYAGQGMQDQARQVLESALEMDPNNQAIREKLGLGAPAPEPQETAFHEAATDLGESIPSLDQAAEIPILEATPPPAPDEFTFSDEPAGAPPVPEEISFDQPFTIPETPEEKQELFTEEVPEQQQPLTEEFAEAPRFEAPEEPQTAPAFSEEVDTSEIWAEAEFYYQQGLFDEARKHYEKIIEYAPENAQARSRLSEITKEQEDVQEFSKLVDGLDGLERPAEAGEAVEGEMAASASDEEAVRLLMQEISQLKQKSEQPPKPAKPAAPVQEEPFVSRARETAPAFRPEEDFLDLGAELNQAGSSLHIGDDRGSAESGDFFDLASELRDELSSVSVPPPSSNSADEQSLDDIFEEFKRGVEQQATREDADTHYNLGVAYKEMGLLDDAIGEFILTPEDEPKYIQSRYMLGLCYMEKGDYQNAIQEIQYALSSTAVTGAMSRDAIGMCYDLGLAYQGAGDRDSAISEFQKVHGADPDYRDVAVKIYELQQGTVISLDQLKDDIEKEISSKFMEEGERIEREEKTRKNEKIHG